MNWKCSSSFPWAVAACFALAAGWTLQLYFASQSQAALIRDQLAFADLSLRGARQQLEAERIVSTQQIGGLNRDLTEKANQLAGLTQKLKTGGDVANLKITTLASMPGSSSAALAVAVWNSEAQEGVLEVEKLPALAANR